MKLLVATCCVSLLPLSAAFGAPLGISQLVVFGDSLSDTGNAAFGTLGILPGPATNYASGEFTDGPSTSPSTTGPQGIWVDQIAPKLGVPVPQAAYATSGGTDYAVGSADTGINKSFPGILQAPYVTQQVGSYLSSNKPSSTSLYSFWAGANDIADMKSPQTAADNIYNNILSLAQAGGKNFLWFNLPPLGQTPAAISQGPAYIVGGDAAAAAFNAEWQTDIGQLMSQGIFVIGVDTASIFNRVTADFESGCTVGASDPYCFANITQGAQGQSVDPNTYLFWDKEHPTTAGQALIADLAYSDIVATPEPASITLAFLGIAGLGLAGFRSRRS
ncbi:MAG: SGNH/GDSL hydrolase family protein [Acidobacteriota bacterium]|nr:SGNH/GDSL hydrolase family protein [Acidobacteriota bacterium]